MANKVVEARSWREEPLEADELRQLLEAVQAALASHDGPLCCEGLADLLDVEREPLGEGSVHAI